MKTCFLALVFLPVIGSAQLWQSDFSTPTDWISADLNSGTDTWVINNSAIGGDVDSISSASAGNDFAQFNSAGQCSGNHQDVTLTYFQPIDITANELSYLQFVQHYKRKTDTVYVEFSNDGLVWESIRINPDMWYHQQSDDPDTVQVSIPATAQATPFWLRFRYSGGCGFAWLMDDLEIFEKEQFAIKANGQITMNGLGYTQLAHCFSDTLNGDLKIENFGYDTLFDVVIETTVLLNGLLDFVRYDTVPQINPEEEILFTQADLIVDPFYYPEDFNLDYKVYAMGSDTARFKDSITITYTTTDRYSGNEKGNFISSWDSMGVGNLLIASEYLCPIDPLLYVPDNPDAIGLILWLVYYKKNAGIWEYYTGTEDYLITSSDLGTWVNLGPANLNGYPYYEPGDTGLVFYMTYGDHPVPYGDRDQLGAYFLSGDGNLTYDTEGHAALIRLMPYGGFSCMTCWEGIGENLIGVLELLPNPATTEIQIINVNQPIHSIVITSIDGRQIQLQTSVIDTTIPIDFLAPGTYLILVEDETGKIYSEKFVKL